MIKVNHKILPEKFWVAVSGGVDSIACAHLLHRMGFDIGIAHFNHNVSSINNDMERVVEDFVIDYDLPYMSSIRSREHVPASAEAYLRNCRMDFFRQLGGDVVTCHHLDDAVESYTMNFLRGCPEYIPIRWETKFNNSDFSILHPFLRTIKDDIIEYVENNDLMKFVVEDPTNKESKFRRNWVRNEILPQFGDFGLRKIVRKKYYS